MMLLRKAIVLLLVLLLSSVVSVSALAETEPQANDQADQVSGVEFVGQLNDEFLFAGDERLNAADLLDEPDKKLSREEAAVVVARVLELDTDISMDPLNAFHDASSVRDENRAYVNAVLAEGLMTGDSDSILQPKRHITRTEAASMLSLAGKVWNKTHFFPIGVWTQSPHNAQAYKDIGVNMFINLWDPMSDQALAYLKDAGMRVIANQRTDQEYMNEKLIYGWMQNDEPDNAQPDGHGGWGPPVPPQDVIAEYNRMKQIDPSRPVFLNLGQGVAWPDWYGRGVDTGRTDVYYEYAKAGDILSFDVYPVNSGDRIHNQLWQVAAGVDNLKTYSGNAKPTWAIIESTNYGGQPGRQPTPEQVKAEVWMALVHGSNGLGYFAHIFAPKFDEPGLLHDDVMRPAVAAINKQIKQLAPVLNSPTVSNGTSVSSSNADVPIDIMVKRYKGASYVFSVGMRDGSTTGTFTVPEGSKVEVIGEGRTLPIVDGKFTDEFAAYGVHLYKIVK